MTHQVKGFVRRPSKTNLRKFEILQTKMNAAFKHTPETSPLHEDAMMRALDCMLPRDTWKDVVKFGLVCASVVACVAIFFWGVKG